MDKTTVEVMQRFIKRLQKEFSIDKVILFGSRARGNHLNKSDFDIIIISKDFEEIPFIRRMEQVSQYWDEDYDVDLIPYTPKEYERKSKDHGTIRKARKEACIFSGSV